MSEAKSTTLSLRRRLALSLIGGAAFLTILLFFSVRYYAVQIAQQSQDNILAASVSSILDAAVILDGEIEVDFPNSSFSMLSTNSDDRIFYAIHQGDRLLSGYNSLPSMSDLNNKPAFQYGRVDGSTVRIAAASRILVGSNFRTTVRVTVAQTQDALSGTLAQISRNTAFLGLGFFVFAVLLSIWATSNTIVPLTRLADSVARRGPQDLTPVSSPVPQELAPLVSSLNKLMLRLEQSLDRSEDFIAEAAHRVRTPLATVRSYAEATLQRVDDEQNRKALRSMVRAIDESSRAASQLLDHAMITFRADHLERQNIDLGELTKELTLRLTPVAEMRDIEMHLKCDPHVHTKGDPILLQNAIRNLIDNALKYSPPESVIDIDVTAEPTPRVIICDQGAGFEEDEIDQLPSRFERGRNAVGITGSGLGLTIAADVALAHGGALLLKNHEKGGRMRYILTLIFWLCPVIAITQEWEDHRVFEGLPGSTSIRILSSTDTSFFAPLIEQYQLLYPTTRVEYLVTGSADIDETFRASPDEFDVVISSAMDLQFKLANDGFALVIEGIDSPPWAQWRQSLYAFTSEPAAIVLNRADFEGHPLPKSRQQLIEALRARPDTFRGRVGTYDVRRSGLGYLFATQDARASETFWRLMEVMGGLDAKLYCCSGDMIDDLVSGELAVAYNVLGSYASARTDDLDTIEIVLPADFPTTMMRTGFVSKQTSNPQQATEFMRFLISKQPENSSDDGITLPGLDATSDNTQQFVIALEPALMTYLDRLKRRKFLQAWSNAVIQ